MQSQLPDCHSNRPTPVQCVVLEWFQSIIQYISQITLPNQAEHYLLLWNVTSECTITFNTQTEFDLL